MRAWLLPGFLLLLVALLPLAERFSLHDPDAGPRQRTTKQIAEIRSGYDNSLFHPDPDALALFSRDPTVNQRIASILCMSDVSAPSYASLAEFPRLREIILYSTHNTDDFLTLLPACPSVTTLTFDTTDLTDEGLKLLDKFPQIQNLFINSYGDRPTAAGFLSLANLKSLQRLQVITGPSPLDLTALQAALPNCQISVTTEQ